MYVLTVKKLNYNLLKFIKEIAKPILHNQTYISRYHDNNIDKREIG